MVSGRLGTVLAGGTCLSRAAALAWPAENRPPGGTLTAHMGPLARLQDGSAEHPEIDPVHGTSLPALGVPKACP